MKRLIALFGVFVAGSAAAQTAGPSFDCAKAQSANDKAICKDAELSKADRAMVAAYTALLDKLKGEEREALVKDQGRWVASRDRMCRNNYCLNQRYVQRTATLRSMALQPFVAVTEPTLTGSGRFGELRWSYDIAYPRFEAKGIDFAAVNKHYASEALKNAQEATPTDLEQFESEPGWGYEQSFGMERAPGGVLATVAMEFYRYTGGAHGYGATICSAVDLKTGKFVTPAGIFTGDWAKPMYQLVVADLRRQFKEREGNPEALAPEPMNEMLAEAGRYCWRAKHLEVVFNAYDVGAYAVGPYSVEIPYDRLKPMLRADGPIALR